MPLYLIKFEKEKKKEKKHKAWEIFNDYMKGQQLINPLAHPLN